MTTQDTAISGPATAKQTSARSVVSAGILLLYAAWVLLGTATQSPEIRNISPLVGTIALSFVCLGGWLIRDPVAWTSIVIPPVVANTVAVLLPDLRAPLALSALGWMLVWILGARRIWPLWRSAVLRRFRPGSPEWQVHAASQRMVRHIGNGLSNETVAGLVREYNDIAGLITPRTLPTLSAWSSYIETLRDADEATHRRVSRRLAAEYSRLWGPPEMPWRRFRRGSRPTQGTSLEYEYPRVEALLAAGSEREQRQIGAAAARIALASTGGLTAKRAALLDAAGDALASSDVVAELESQRAELRKRLDSLTNAEDRRLAGRELHALTAFQFAIEPMAFPRDRADPVYEAIQALPNRREPGRLETEAASVLGPAGVARAREIP